MQQNGEKAAPNAPVRQIQWMKRAVQCIVVALVIWGIWRTFEKARRDLTVQQTHLQQQLRDLDREWQQRKAADRSAEDRARYLKQRKAIEAQRFEWSNLKPGWLLMAGVIYLCGTLPGWYFWHTTLVSLHQRPAAGTTLRAYTVGQLGKYVPGKALVVIMRAGGVSGPSVDWFVAAAAVFIETLTMMAVGAALGGVLLVMLFRKAVHPGLLAAAVGLTLISWVPTIPTIFRFVVAKLQRNGRSHLQQALDGLNRSLILRGWIIMPIGWLLMGLSLWAVAQAAPGAAKPELWPSLESLALHTACTALAVVLGFASFIPGGFGVRELVMTTLLAPTYGTVRALVIAVLMRLVWLLSELCFSGVLILISRLPALPQRAATEPQ